MSYLDDPDHVWRLEPSARNDAELVLRKLLGYEELGPADLDVIVRGARGLRDRGLGPRARCFDTALIWHLNWRRAAC